MEQWIRSRSRTYQVVGVVAVLASLAFAVAFFDPALFGQMCDTVKEQAAVVATHWLTWHILFYGSVATWVLVDSTHRRQPFPVLWVIGVLVFGTLVIPVYCAIRNLRHGEVREGGFGWNLLRGFVLMWTASSLLILAYFSIAAAIITGWAGIAVQNNPEVAKSLIAASRVFSVGMSVGFIVLCCVWILPMVGAAALGFFLKNSSIVERGPTGALASRDFAFSSSSGSIRPPDDIADPTTTNGH